MLTDAEITEILSHYAVGTLLASRALTQGSVQTNLLLDTTKGKFVLRYYRQNRSLQAVQFEVNLIAYLKRHGYPCAAVLKNRAGKLAGETNGKPYALFEFLEGIAHRAADGIAAATVDRAGCRITQAHPKLSPDICALSLELWRGTLSTIERRDRRVVDWRRDWNCQCPGKAALVSSGVITANSSPLAPQRCLSRRFSLFQRALQRRQLSCADRLRRRQLHLSDLRFGGTDRAIYPHLSLGHLERFSRQRRISSILPKHVASLKSISNIARSTQLKRNTSLMSTNWAFFSTVSGILNGAK